MKGVKDFYFEELLTRALHWIISLFYLNRFLNRLYIIFHYIFNCYLAPEFKKRHSYYKLMHTQHNLVH